MELPEGGILLKDILNSPTRTPIRRRRRECFGFYREFFASLPINKGDRVALAKTYTVLAISEDRAVCLPDDGSEAVEIRLSELVRI